MSNDISSHEFTPTLGDPGLCGVGICGAPWFHPVHNPANNPKWGGVPRTFAKNGSYTEILNEAIIRADEANRSLFADPETVSAPAEPKCPVGNCTNTFPHLHPRQEAGPGEPDTVPDALDALKREAACAFTEELAGHLNPVVERPGSPRPDWVDMLREVTPQHRFAMKSANQILGKTIENADYCDNCDCLFDNMDVHPNFRPLRCAYHRACADLSFDRPSQLAEHQFMTHGLDNWEIMEYLKDPWLVGEPRATWKERSYAQHYGRKGADSIVQVEVNVDPTDLQDALRRFSESFPKMAGYLAASDSWEAAGTPTEAREEPDFRDWWVAWVDDAAPTIQRKAAEYGSNSLAEMGRMFARAQGRGHIEDHEALEIGCMIYTKGKIERVLDAMLQGTLPSADTWGDTMIYAAMASYIREFRRWP